MDAIHVQLSPSCGDAPHSPVCSSNSRIADGFGDERPPVEKVQPCVPSMARAWRLNLKPPGKLSVSRDGPQLMQHILSAADNAAPALGTLDMQEPQQAAPWHTSLPAVKSAVPGFPADLCSRGTGKWQLAGSQPVRRCLYKSLAAAAGATALARGSILSQSNLPAGSFHPTAPACCAGCSSITSSDVQQWLLSMEQALRNQPAHQASVAAAAAAAAAAVPSRSAAGMQASADGYAQQGKKRCLLRAESLDCSSTSKVGSAALQDTMLPYSKRRSYAGAVATVAGYAGQQTPTFSAGVWQML